MHFLVNELLISLPLLLGEAVLAETIGTHEDPHILEVILLLLDIVLALHNGEVEDLARGSEPTATQKGRGTTVHLSGRMIAEKRSAREPDGEKGSRHRLRRTRGQGDPCSFVVHIKP